MVPALKFPELSRFTIELAVLFGSGATSHPRPSVPLVFTGYPVTTKSVEGAVNATLVTVPPPLRLAHAQALPLHAST